LNAIGKYPFERFSDDAKQALVAAQKEAEISQRGYIGTEHILLGLLRIGSGSAYRALSKLAIDAETVRTMIEKAIRGARRSGLPQPIPTTRVKRVVEIAFEESRRMGWQTVESGHVLMGLAIEGEGVAALVLKDLGATKSRVIWEVERELKTPAAGRAETQRRPPEAAVRQAEPLSRHISRRCGRSWHRSGL
jgi:ATP-dependent Clp protease ATP-binding subunit ClpC